MARRTNTVIIVPHNKAKFYKLSFSSRAAVAAGVAIVLAFVLSIVALVSSGTGMTRRMELERLRAENLELKKANETLERTIGEVQGRLEEFEERTARLALAAGLEPDRTFFPGADDGGAMAGRGGPYDRVPESPDDLLERGEWIDRGLQRLEKVLDRREKTLVSTPTIAPVHGLITDGFGRRRDPFTGRWAIHRGLDIAARVGTPVVAPADGVVVETGRERGFGRIVRISHGTGYTTIYGHLHRILVRPGQKVHRGETIGLVGSSGRSTGPHLHYEVHKNGRAVNPLYYILDAY